MATYSRGVRYQPPGVVERRQLFSWQRRRFHDSALRVIESTNLRTNNSSLEEIVLAWNRIPSELSQLSKSSLKRQLKSTGYMDATWSAHLDLQHVAQML